jgi:hypothetical protein
MDHRTPPDPTTQTRTQAQAAARAINAALSRLTIAAVYVRQQADLTTLELRLRLPDVSEGLYHDLPIAGPATVAAIAAILATQPPPPPAIPDDIERQAAANPYAVQAPPRWTLPCNPRQPRAKPRQRR